MFDVSSVDEMDPSRTVAFTWSPVFIMRFINLISHYYHSVEW